MTFRIQDIPVYYNAFRKLKDLPKRCFKEMFDHNRLVDYILKLTPEIIATQALKPDERQIAVEELH